MIQLPNESSKGQQPEIPPLLSLNQDFEARMFAIHGRLQPQ